jgi:hypothetical protein
MKLTAYFISYNFLRIALIILILNCFANSLRALESDSLFKSDYIIKMELRSDFSSIQKERTGKAQYHDGELVYYSPDGKPVKLMVKLIIRGHFRRDTANCNFPPLYVNFRKGEVKNTIFKNQNELKLVTPCMYENDVIDEYLIYKMYNKVTDLSFKVRLVKILYYDTSIEKKLFEKYSFFLERKEDVANRNNCIVKDELIAHSDIDREYLKRMSVFQYMIGNHDWFFRLNVGTGQQYVKLNHNLEILQPKDSTLAPYAVPYDFDLSAFVNADYAQSMMGNRSYKGLCYSTDEFEEVFGFYKELRPDLESVINDIDLISVSSRKKGLKYIESFYNVIEDSKLIKKEFLDECKTSIDRKFVIQ